MVDGPHTLKLQIATLRVEEGIEHGGGNAIALHPIMEGANVQGILLSPVLATHINVKVYLISLNTSSTNRCIRAKYTG
jgi:hypothetical protein